MFPDSKIALGFASGRTKTTAIVKYALAPALNAQVIEECQSSPFTLLCDGGNDQMGKKYFGIMVRYWSETASQPVTRFLAMPICNEATAEALFGAMAEELRTRDIPWSNVIGYASDTASVIVGQHNSVLSRIHEKQPKLFSLGCLCHLAALCAAAALKKLPVSVDNLLIDIYYHFKHSSKRWSEFADIRAEFSDIKPLRVLKHSTSRWLSLERCVKRLIEQWPALYAYFDRQVDIEPTDDHVQRVAKQLADPEVKLFCHFVAYAIKPINKFNIAFQTHASRIGTLRSDVRKLLRRLLSNFVEPDVLRSMDDILSINYQDRDQQVKDDELGIGTSTRMLLCGELEDEVVGTRIETRFFRSVREFYETSVTKMLAKFPFSDNIFEDLAFLDPRNRSLSSPTGMIRLANRFTSLETDEIDCLVMELRDYRAASDSELPTFDHREYAAIDHFWAAMAEVKLVTDEESFRFGMLSRVAKVLLILPHSNADPERLFSMVRKIETELRKQLDPSTVCDLLSVKVNNDNPCYGNKPLLTEDMLASAKSATRRSLSKVTDDSVDSG